jgi:putative MATE family efflux protein
MPVLALRSPHDREILRLALPALGALAAGPLYTLVDTAIVGHLGVRPLAALALAGTLLAAIIELADFLSYGTTAQVARLHAGGERDEAGGVVAQALWLSAGTGLAAMAIVLALSGPLLTLIGHGAGVQGLAELYVRIVAAGIPAQLVALAGEGCLRGLGDLRSPLRILVAANLANVVLEVIFVYGLHMGLAGSAIGTLIAQLGMGAAFVRRMLAVPADRRAPALSRIKPLLRTGGHITVRTAALLAAFTLCSARAAHLGAAALGAHQVAFELFLFLALVLDAIAIAGQVLVARLLGAGEPQQAWSAALRMLGWSLLAGLAFGLVLLALSGIGPRAFSSSASVLASSHPVWRLLALMQPAAGAVFALDGILIGAGDTRYLAVAMVAALAAFLPAALAATSVTALWWSLNLLILLRLVTLLPRFARRRWAIVGARV